MNAKTFNSKEPASKNQLEFQIVALNSEEKINEWRNTPFSHGVQFQSISNASVNRPIYIVSLMSGTMKDPQNYVNIAIDIKITDPNGNILTDMKNFEEIKNRFTTL